LAGESLFRAAKPRKLRVQCGHSLGRAFAGRCARRCGWWWCAHQGAAGALVAPVSSAATRSEKAQLHRSFVKKNVREVRHSLFRTTTFALVRKASNSLMAVGADIQDEGAKLGRSAAGRELCDGCRREGRIRSLSPLA
jgi:hypothetical protein